jgi:hypothetical protein
MTQGFDNENAYISLIYKVDKEYKIEKIRAIKIGNFYQVKDIPIFSSGLSIADIISVEREGEHLFFEKIIRPSGHSVVHVAVLKPNTSKEILENLRMYKIDIHSINNGIYLALDIPPNTPYPHIKEYLDNQLKIGNLEYEEAALSAEHYDAITSNGRGDNILK